MPACHRQFPHNLTSTTTCVLLCRATLRVLTLILLACGWLDVVMLNVFRTPPLAHCCPSVAATATFTYFGISLLEPSFRSARCFLWATYRHLPRLSTATRTYFPFCLRATERDVFFARTTYHCERFERNDTAARTGMLAFAACAACLRFYLLT